MIMGQELPLKSFFQWQLSYAADNLHSKFLSKFPRHYTSGFLAILSCLAACRELFRLFFKHHKKTFEKIKTFVKKRIPVNFRYLSGPVSI